VSRTSDASVQGDIKKAINAEIINVTYNVFDGTLNLAQSLLM